MIRNLGVCIILASLCGCNWIGRQADALGEHMPVIGERCEHWQCITESGRARSDMYKQQRELEESGMQVDPAAATQQQVQQQGQQQYQQQQYQQPAAQQPAPATQYQNLESAPTPYDYYNQ